MVWPSQQGPALAGLTPIRCTHATDLKSPKRGGSTVFPRASGRVACGAWDCAGLRSWLASRLPVLCLHLRCALLLPQATRYHVEPTHSAAQQGGQSSTLARGGGGSAAGSLAQSRRLQQDGDAGAGTEPVPWYCQEGTALQVAPSPGSAVLFW